MKIKKIKNYFNRLEFSGNFRAKRIFAFFRWPSSDGVHESLTLTPGQQFWELWVTYKMRKYSFWLFQILKCKGEGFLFIDCIAPQSKEMIHLLVFIHPSVILHQLCSSRTRDISPLKFVIFTCSEDKGCVWWVLRWTMGMSHILEMDLWWVMQTASV